MKRIALILGALALFTNASSCQKAENENNPQEKKLYRFEVSLPETKVYFGEPSEGHIPVLWKEGDALRIITTSAESNVSTDHGTFPVVPSADGKTAVCEMEIELPKEGILTVFSPGTAVDKICGTNIQTYLPTEQTPLAGSPDPKAIVLMCTRSIPQDPNAHIDLIMTNYSSYGCMTLEGLSSTPKKVFISSKEFEGLNLTLNTSFTKNIYFGCQRSLTAGSKLTISVLTETGTVSKTITLPANANFKSGIVARFTVDMSEAVPSKTPIFDEDNIVFSFGAISDTHINDPANAHAKKLTSALTQLQVKASEKDANGLDAVVVAGDLTDQPTNLTSQTQYFKTLYEQVFDPEKVPMIYTVGNHDGNPSYWWTVNTVAQATPMRSVLGDKYFLYDQDNENRLNFECRDCLVNGFHILSVTPNANNPVDYDLNVKTWLNNRLKAITEAEPEKFVIVNTHPMIENTVYGSLLGTPMGKAISDIWESGDTWATRNLSEVLNQYPQVVTFSGHLHFPLNDPRSIWQAAFTSFGCGSTRYMAIENGKYQDMKSATVMNDCEQFSQGWLIQIDANGNMRATPMDFYNQAVIGTPYEISYPQADLSHLKRYGANRIESNRKPVLPSLDIEEKIVGSAKSYSAVWEAGQDMDFVHHYVLKLSKGGSVVWTKNTSRTSISIPRRTR